MSWKIQLIRQKKINKQRKSSFQACRLPNTNALYKFILKMLCRWCEISMRSCCCLQKYNELKWGQPRLQKMATSGSLVVFFLRINRGDSRCILCVLAMVRFSQNTRTYTHMHTHAHRHAHVGTRSWISTPPQIILQCTHEDNTHTYTHSPSPFPLRFHVYYSYSIVYYTLPAYIPLSSVLSSLYLFFFLPLKRIVSIIAYF